MVKVGQKLLLDCCSTRLKAFPNERMKPHYVGEI